MSAERPALAGYLRTGGAVGARNHVLVLPSVVCSTRVAGQIAGDRAVTVTHQHGCGHVGDDVEHTSSVFSRVAANPNVAAALVVGLGCETIGGEGLARAIAALGQRVAFVGIQESGGSAATVARGEELLEELIAEAAAMARQPAPTSCLRLGLDDPAAPFAGALAAKLADLGATLVLAEDAPAGERCHAELAAAGAQVIVAWCGPGDGPRSFATCPVVSVSGDAELYGALVEDFDLGPSAAGDAEGLAEAVLEGALATFSGAETAAERRGAAEFSLHRLVRSM